MADGFAAAFRSSDSAQYISLPHTLLSSQPQDVDRLALLDAGEPIYQRGAVLVRPIVDKVDAARGRSTKVAQLKIIDTVYLTDRLNIVADWVKYDARSQKMVPINSPVQVAATIQARHGHWKFPPLAGVITTPTMRPDGSLLTKAGYDPATRLADRSKAPERGKECDRGSVGCR